MLNFFKRYNKLPEFEILKAFDKKDFYFIRTAEWDWMDKKNIIVCDPHGPRILTFGPWPQLVFIGADGQKTIWEFVYYMAGEYNGKIPELLDKAIIDEISTLLEYRVVELSQSKSIPKPEFELPKSDKNYKRQ